MQPVVKEVAFYARRERNLCKEIKHHIVLGKPLCYVIRIKKRVEGTYFLLLRSTIAIEYRRADDFCLRTLPSNVKNEIRVSNIHILRRIARTKVVRANEECDRINITRYIKIDMQVIANTTALIARHNPISTDATVPNPVSGLRDVRSVLIAELPNAKHLRLITIRGKAGCDHRSVLRYFRIFYIVNLIVDTLCNGVTNACKTNLLRFLLIVANRQNKLLVAILRSILNFDGIRLRSNSCTIKEIIEVLGERNRAILVRQKHNAPEIHIRIIIRKLKLHIRAKREVTLSRTPNIDWRLNRVILNSCVIRNRERLNVKSACAFDNVIPFGQCRRGLNHVVRINGNAALPDQ